MLLLASLSIVLPAAHLATAAGAPCNHAPCTVGAGIGGLSAASLLAKYGYSVTVCESHDRVGGAAHGFTRRTAAGTLLAFAEARRENCSDFARTDLVVRRSVNGGMSWSPLALVGAPSSSESPSRSPQF